MTTNVWRAGKISNIYAPSAWKGGTPHPGDTLVIGQGTAFIGDGWLKTSTIVLSGNESATQPTLVAQGSANVNVLVQQEVYTYLGGFVPVAFGTVEVSGAPTVHLTVAGQKAASHTGTVKIDAHSQMRGTFVALANNASVVINGESTSTFANTGASSVAYNDFAEINAAVVGQGTFNLVNFSSMSFASGVGSGQTINDAGGALQILDAKDFHATVNLSAGYANTDAINLRGLVADSDTYHEGVLSLFSGGHNVFSMHVSGVANIAFAPTGVTLTA